MGSDPMNDMLVVNESSGGVATITLNRPKQFNALSEELLGALQQTLEDVAADTAIRVVVLASKGKAFCAGHDLKQMRATPAEAYYQSLFTMCSRMMMTINQMPQPVIARVHGLATAAGCQLVAACDLAVAADTATFATSGIRVGLFCATPAVSVSRNLTRKHALELLLTGEFIDAATAAKQGLINRAVPPDQLDATVQWFVQSILAKSDAAVRIGKKAFYEQIEMGMADAYEHASATMARNMMSADASEGIDAFLQKRPPSWSHR